MRREPSQRRVSEGNKARTGLTWESASALACWFFALFSSIGGGSTPPQSTIPESWLSGKAPVLGTVVIALPDEGNRDGRVRLLHSPPQPRLTLFTSLSCLSIAISDKIANPTKTTQK